MIGLWSVVGRACIHKEFGDKIHENTDGKKPPDLKKLYEFLIEENKYILSRWELGEVNRIFQIISIRDAMKEVQTEMAKKKIWENEGNFWIKKVWCVVGVACMDQHFCENLAAAAQNGATVKGKKFNDLLKHFLIEEKDKPILLKIFQNKKIVKLMPEIDKIAWTKPETEDGEAEFTPCKWSFSYSPQYKHKPF